MWWEYLIIFACLILSIYLIARHFYKNLSRDKCENGCHACTQKCDQKDFNSQSLFVEGRNAFQGQDKS